MSTKEKSAKKTAMSIKVIYIACKYTRGGKADEQERLQNLDVADYWCKRLWALGYAVIHPIRNVSGLENTVHFKDIIRADLAIIERVDAIFMAPGWEQSKGARREHAYAKKIGKPIMYWDDYLKGD